jgi:hypothetical protein
LRYRIGVAAEFHQCADGQLRRQRRDRAVADSVAFGKQRVDIGCPSLVAVYGFIA